MSSQVSTATCISFSTARRQTLRHFHCAPTYPLAVGLVQRLPKINARFVQQHTVNRERTEDPR
jgi:hypothetical protein